jgi:hypothetical protein
VPNGKNFDSIVVSFYERDDLVYVARVRNGFTPSSRDAVFKKFRGLEPPNCPFVNLPKRDKGRWGVGLTAEKMVECRWLKPRLRAQIEYAEWTDGNHLRHSKFVAIREHEDPRDFGDRITDHQMSSHPRLGFASTSLKSARKSVLSACSAGDFPFDASQFSKSSIRTLCSTSGSLTTIVIVEF